MVIPDVRRHGYARRIGVRTYSLIILVEENMDKTVTTKRIVINWKVLGLNMAIKFCEGAMATCGVLFVVSLCVGMFKFMGVK